MNLFTSPLLWLGARAFRRHRIESYEALAESLGDRSRSAPVTLRKTIQKWAERDRERGDTRAAVFAQIDRRLGLGGTSFAQALRPFIPDDEFLILSSGEVQGDTQTALELVIRNIQATTTMTESVRAAMAQPALGVASLLALSIFNGIMVWPTFLGAIPRKYWPGWALPCIDGQLWLTQHGYVLVLLLGVVGAYYATLKTWTGTSRDWADHLPPWSIYKARQASSLLGVMAALVTSGRTVRQSFELVRTLSTPYMHWHLSRMLSRYDASGQDAMSAMRTGLFSRPVVDRIEDAAGNRTFEKTLAYVGDTSLKVIVRLVTQQASTANWIFMVLIGLGFIYMTAVSVVGAQEATDAYTKVIQGGSTMLK